MVQICIYASAWDELGCLDPWRIQLRIVNHVKRVLHRVNLHGLVAKRHSLVHNVSFIAQMLLARDESWVELRFLEVNTLVVTAALHSLPSVDLGMTYAEGLVFSDGCRVSYVVEQRLQLNINIEVVF